MMQPLGRIKQSLKILSGNVSCGNIFVINYDMQLNMTVMILIVLLFYIATWVVCCCVCVARDDHCLVVTRSPLTLPAQIAAPLATL